MEMLIKTLIFNDFGLANLLDKSHVFHANMTRFYPICHAMPINNLKFINTFKIINIKIQ